MRRNTGNVKGERYLGNTSPTKKEVHDLDAEKTNCQIDEIIRAGNDRPFNSLTEAKQQGYDNCHYCLGASAR